MVWHDIEGLDVFSRYIASARSFKIYIFLRPLQERRQEAATAKQSGSGLLWSSQTET